jgi:hypothetical protein
MSEMTDERMGRNRIALIAEIDRLRTENNRYQGALEDIAHHLPVGTAQDRLFTAMDIAQHALNSEPTS